MTALHRIWQERARRGRNWLYEECALVYTPPPLTVERVVGAIPPAGHEPERLRVVANRLRASSDDEKSGTERVAELLCTARRGGLAECVDGGWRRR